MEPEVWGPKGWFFLHSITMAYPEKPSQNDKDNYAIFFNILPTVLPCEVCQKHLRQHMANNPIQPALENRQTLVEWLINIHNMANQSLGKPVMTYDQVIEKYKKEYSNSQSFPDLSVDNDKKTNMTYIGIIVVAILIIGLILWKRSVLFA